MTWIPSSRLIRTVSVPVQSASTICVQEKRAFLLISSFTPYEQTPFALSLAYSPNSLLQRTGLLRWFVAPHTAHGV